MQSRPLEATMMIGENSVESADVLRLTAPHDHGLRVADVHQASSEHVRTAIAAALKTAPSWARMPFEERAAIFLRAADLLATRYRPSINAATIIGQSKSVQQAEIDAACELIDFWRFNAHFGARIHREQPISTSEAHNTLDYRPLDGFVLAITPFNFTAIGGNLATAPALMGNTVIWKPSVAQALSAQYTMKVLLEAGLPPGVINLVHGDGGAVANIAIGNRGFAGLNFTGSSAVFRGLCTLSANRMTDAVFPRLSGETGGKGFVLAHPSAEVDALCVALARGAFEYQGQKCSAASRAYIPKSLWPAVRRQLAGIASEMPMGDVADPRMFLGAVINEPAFQRHARAIREAGSRGDEIVVGGKVDDSVGWFVQPTVIRTTDRHADTMTRELFGPILTVFVYDDSQWSTVLELIDTSTTAALTGAVFATDEAAVDEALIGLRSAAGNFYINDKPTGAVVGQQPFGGSRSSGTNDKAGALSNLLRWTSPRTIKRQLRPITDWRYPHMGDVTRSEVGAH